MSINQAAEVLRELQALEASGVKLPMPAKEILKIEVSGHTVDLVTGEVSIGGSARRYLPTVAGAAEVQP